MPLTNFPDGISSFGVPQIGSGPVFTTGNVYFVQSTGALASDSPSPAAGSKERPFATIAYAITQCTANNGDVILVMPGHAEVVTDTTDGLDVDIAGLRIVGVPNGGQKPSITLDATGAFIDLAVDGTTLENLRIIAGAADVTAAVYVTGDDCAVLGCSFLENTTNENFIGCVEGFGGSDRGRVEGCTLIQPDGATGTYGIRTGQGDGWVVRNNLLVGDWALYAIRLAASTNPCTNVVCDRNIVYNADTAADGCIDAAALSTGVISNNMCAGLHATDGVNAGDCGALENYYVIASNDLSGVIEPAIV